MRRPSVDTVAIGAAGEADAAAVPWRRRVILSAAALAQISCVPDAQKRTFAEPASTAQVFATHDVAVACLRCWSARLHQAALHAHRVPAVPPVLRFMRQHACHDDHEAYSTLSIGAGSPSSSPRTTPSALWQLCEYKTSRRRSLAESKSAKSSCQSSHWQCAAKTMCCRSTESSVLSHEMDATAGFALQPLLISTRRPRSAAVER